MRKPIIKAGDKFNELTAIRLDHRDKYGRQYWIFRCDCGTEKVIFVFSVKSENTKSCGCLVSKRNFKHGMSKTKTFISWCAMKQRCFYRNHKDYKNYGGRGIKVCPRWLGKNGFKNFYADMGERPASKTLDRKDNNLGYCKSNCRWATPTEQNNNRRKRKI